MGAREIGRRNSQMPSSRVIAHRSWAHCIEGIRQLEGAGGSGSVLPVEIALPIADIADDCDAAARSHRQAPPTWHLQPSGQPSASAAAKRQDQAIGGRTCFSSYGAYPSALRKSFFASPKSSQNVLFLK